jgi:AhpD family alkylhydroperoxidase
MTHRNTKVSFALAAALALPVAVSTPARAETPAAARADIQRTVGFVPAFVAAIPDPVLPGLWGEIKGFELNPATALPVKVKELIGLAVSAQTSCKGCIYSYAKCAKANGATAAEVGEAVGMAALTRRWSTHFNGLQLDEPKFRAEIARLVANAKAGGPPPRPMAVVDAASAQADMKQSLGFLPEFFATVPPEAAAGAWLGEKGLEMNPSTALSGKHKSLISLAVASQVPCRYCVIADTEFAKLEGATDREIREAVTMAGMARQLGTLLEGLEIDEKAFRRDVDRMTAGEAKAKVARQ